MAFSQGKTKIQAVLEFSVPSNVHTTRQFVRLASYFRKFVKGLSEIRKTLTELTKKDVTYRWGAREQETFEKLETSLRKRPFLAMFEPKDRTDIVIWG